MHRRTWSLNPWDRVHPLGIQFFCRSNRFADLLPYTYVLSKLILFPTAVIAESSFSKSLCFDVSIFVPTPVEDSVPKKFSDLSTLSKELKSALWVAKIELLSNHDIVHKSAFGFLPHLVLENIARYLPDKGSESSPQFIPYVLRPRRRAR
jgi:hypothetical protein